MSSQAGAPDVPGRCVLDGVPRVGFYPKQSTSAPEDHVFPACVRSCLEYLKDDIYEDWIAPHATDWHGVHIYAMGASGLAFGFSWRAGDWKDQTAWVPTYASEDPLEPVRRTLQAVGYDGEILLRRDFGESLGIRDGCDDERVYRDRIVASIGAGRPVIAFGVVGPPDACVVTGYDGGGEVLIGWSFFQDDHRHAEAVETEPSGYFRKPDWFRDTQGLVVLGEKRGRPPRAVAYRDAVLWGLHLLRTVSVRGVPAGQSAYEAWLADLADDRAVATLDRDGLLAARDAHDGAGGHLAEARCWADSFLDQAARALPAAVDEFRAAGGCFLLTHDLVWRQWQTLGPGDEDAKAKRLARVDVRADLRRIVGVFREMDAVAATHLERGLLALGVSRDLIPPASDEERVLVAAAEARAAGSLGVRSQFIRRGTEGAWVEGVPALPALPPGGDGLLAALVAAAAPTRRPCEFSELAERTATCPSDARVGERIAAVAATTGWPLHVEGCCAELDEVLRARLATDTGLSVNAGLPVVVGYGEGFAVAYGYHCWSESIFVRVPGGGDDAPVRVHPNDPLLKGPFVFLE